MKQDRQQYIEVKSLEELPQPADGLVQHYVFQYIDFRKAPDYATKMHFCDCLFTGCIIPANMRRRFYDGCLDFPRLGMPYVAFRTGLYTGRTLYEGFDPAREESFEECFDTRIYKDYITKGKRADCFKETLARTLHDHSISDAMHDLLARYDEKDVVAIMGGHAMKRSDECYAKIACISKKLTEAGKLMVSGGGPGAMEATHLGAWMAGRSGDELRDALSMLACEPTFRNRGWLSSAFAVIDKYPQDKYRSLGVPTWFYGHEPATPFATDIAKYFDNSIREDGILTIAMGGIIYTPGAAGTLQEIFQDGAQNHYETFGYASPMVFFGVDYYTKEIPVYPLLQQLMKDGKYQHLILSITDDCDEAADFLINWK